MVEKYSFGDVMTRYNMQRTALSKFLTRHLAEINKDGLHAAKNGRAWKFDETAIQIMDRIRGEFQPGVFNEPEPRDSESVELLKNQISNLQQLLLAAQKDAIDAKNETINALRERDQLKNELATVSLKYAQLQASQDASSYFASELKQLHKQNDVLCKQIEATFAKMRHNSNGNGWTRRGGSRKIKLNKL